MNQVWAVVGLHSLKIRGGGELVETCQQPEKATKRPKKCRKSFFGVLLMLHHAR